MAARELSCQHHQNLAAGLAAVLRPPPKEMSQLAHTNITSTFTHMEKKRKKSYLLFKR